MRATLKCSSFRHFLNNKKKYKNFSNFSNDLSKNSFVLKTIYFRFKNIFALQMIYK